MVRFGHGNAPRLAAALVLLAAGGCGGGEEEGPAARARAFAAQEAPSSSDRVLLERLPDMCPLFSPEEASKLLGAEAHTPEGAPNEGVAGGLCRYTVNRQNRLGFALFMLPLDVWDPSTGTIEELVAVSDQTRTSEGPELEPWAGAPGLGGYYGESEGGTTVWVVTPYGWTPGMSDEPTSQVYLRAYIESQAPPAYRLRALTELAETVIPRLAGD